MSFRTRPRSREVHLNVTPLIDVLFLFIIFFTLTSTFKRAGELELQLPESTTSESVTPDDRPELVELIATEDGRLYLEGHPVEMAELGARLRSLREGAPDRAITIQAEAGVRHEEVVRLLDRVRDAGFAGVGIGTHQVMAESPEEPPAGGPGRTGGR